MQARVERKSLPVHAGIEPGRAAGVENHVPAVGRNHAREENESMCFHQRGPEFLLAGSGRSGPQPVRIGKACAFDHMHLARIGNPRPGEDMGFGVERAKPLVHRHFEDRRGGIERGIDDARADRAPAPAIPVAALAAVPGGTVARRIEPPENEFARAKRRRQRRHV